MKHLRVLLCGLVLAALPTTAALADSYTIFNLTNVTFANGDAGTGTLTIDTTTGTLKSVDLTYGAYTFTGGQAILFPPGVEVIFAGDFATDVFNFVLPLNSLQNYTGGDLCTSSNHTQLSQCDNFAGYVQIKNPASSTTMETGSLVAGASFSDPPPTGVTPEPASLALFGTGLAGMCEAIRRRIRI